MGGTKTERGKLAVLSCQVRKEALAKSTCYGTLGTVRAVARALTKSFLFFSFLQAEAVAHLGLRYPAVEQAVLTVSGGQSRHHEQTPDMTASLRGVGRKSRHVRPSASAACFSIYSYNRGMECLQQCIRIMSQFSEECDL
jgi:hypothetical protein